MNYILILTRIKCVLPFKPNTNYFRRMLRRDYKMRNFTERALPKLKGSTTPDAFHTSV